MVHKRVTMPQRYLEKILRARVYDVAIETPLDHAPRLSSRLNNNVYLKREDLQPVFSFKLRGAYNKLYQLSDEQRSKGVIAASAGNHAQGVALSARNLKIAATIVMPKTTPAIKVQAVRSHGARTVLFGDSYDEAYAHAMEISEENQQTFLHPFDDPDVIAGQGTIGMEILRQMPEAPDRIYIPVGGGGLIAGIAAYVKYLYPKTKIIGVEPEDSATLHTSLKKGRRTKLKEVGLFADGVAVRMIGKETFRIAKKLVDDVVLVTTDETCAAIKDIFEETRTIAEPAGALSIAGMKKDIAENSLEGQHLVAIESGANVNFDRLRHIAERADFGEQKEALFAVKIPEVPGSFLKFCKLLGKRSITEFNYRYADSQEAHVFCGIELTGGDDERQLLIDKLNEKGYEVQDLTDNEAAKLHIRYMVGGHAHGIEDEKLFRFQFPERPGALLEFLTRLGHRWNISLFHYRNHGSAYGRVLVGIQLPGTEVKDFTASLDKLGYRYWEETDNSAYQLFASTVSKP
ncbi:threonine ammonia-lyase, biosynthetic [Solemya velum gill symbiont]|nr:threonine ammonia-lyase, biosynthetic [Solemya velum gill symbiont]